jgi:hypothetical protein
MTGGIKDILHNSEATRSLRAESKIAENFQSENWDASVGAYYKDSTTRKLREIDVYARRVFSDQSEERKGTNAP